MEPTDIYLPPSRREFPGEGGEGRSRRRGIESNIGGGEGRWMSVIPSEELTLY